jgi:putative oxidoreductase
MQPDRAIARALIAWVFIHGGAATLNNPEPRARMATTFLGRLREAIPCLPDDTTLVRANAAAQVTAGVLLAAGAWERQAAQMLAASLIPTTIAGHPFWSTPDPASRTDQAIQFGKNMGILGALILLAHGRTAGCRADRLAT